LKRNIKKEWEEEVTHDPRGGVKTYATTRRLTEKAVRQ